MIIHEYNTLFGNDSIDKQLNIFTDDKTVTITNTELHNEGFVLEEKLCDENNLVFGLSEPSKIEFTVSNVFADLKNKWLTVTTTLNKDTSNSFQIGRYKVYSDVPTADRKKRNVVAYDALYNVLQADVSAWYNSILPNQNSTTTLKAFRDSFFAHFGIEQEEVTLVNDNMVVAKTIQPEELSGKTVINAICEINGCFGNIGRNGKFRYVYLEKPTDALYPSHDLYPSEDLYPIKVTGTTLTSGLYIPPATYETYVTQKITGLVIRQEEDDIGGQVGSLDNAYVIQDNFLAYGKSNSELQTIGNNILGKIEHISYRPFNTKAKGNFCVEVGDFIKLSTKNQRVESYVLQRTITGIQALRDDYTAEGEEKLPKSTNSVSRQIQQLKGKANILTRTVDETRLEMVDMDKALRSTISATASEISLEVENLDQNLSAKISVLDNQISQKVSSGDVVNEINISNQAITLKGNRLIVESTNFSLDQYGNCSMTGYIDARSGWIGGFELSADGFLINGETILSNHTSYFGAVYTDDINGYTPITSGNIDSHISNKGYLTSSDLSGYATINELSALETDLNNKMNGLDSGLTYVRTRISDLESRVSALEKAI